MKENGMNKIIIIPFLLFLYIPSVSQPVNTPVVKVTSLFELLGTRIHYNFPDILHPKLTLNSPDTVDISSLVKISLSNSYFIKEIQSEPARFERSRKSVRIQDYIQLKDYVICLTQEVRGKDLLIWKKMNKIYRLLAIYPSEIGGCLYCSPDFHSVECDTFSIGTINHEEGGVYGGYHYYVIEADTLRLVKELVANGSCPFGDDGNPKSGATCVSYLNILYDAKGKTTELPIYYECLDKYGNDIYARAVNDSIPLFKMYWQGHGPLLRYVKTNRKKFKVGTSSYVEGKSYIAIEQDGIWYWTLRDEIEIE